MSDFDPADYPEPDGYTLVPQDELDDMAAKASKWDRLQSLLAAPCQVCGEAGICDVALGGNTPLDYRFPVVHVRRLGTDRRPFTDE